MGIVDLLRNLADGMYDGERADSEMNGVSSGFYIDEGTPVKYREGVGTKFFDGKENSRMPGRRTEERYETDEEKTTFFQKYGFKQDMFGAHPEVIDFSKQHYDDEKKK